MARAAIAPAIPSRILPTPALLRLDVTIDTPTVTVTVHRWPAPLQAADSHRAWWGTYVSDLPVRIEVDVCAPSLEHGTISSVQVLIVEVIDRGGDAPGAV
jgi:hypothetical protein